MNPIDPQFPPRPTALAQQLLGPLIRPGDIVIDATAGNGHDTLFLAENVGPDGRVLAFDVQAAAIDSTRRRLVDAGMEGRVDFYQESHVGIATRAEPQSVAAVMFNLGYLPGENHDLTTSRDDTLAALDATAVVLKSGGALTVVCYPGHPAGAEEALAVEKWLAARTADGWRVARFGAIGTRRPAPFLLVAGLQH